MEPTPHDELIASYGTTLLNHASTLEPLLAQRGLLDGVGRLLSIGIGAGHLECRLARSRGIAFGYVERSEPMLAAVARNIAATGVESWVLERHHTSFEQAPIAGAFDLVLSLDSWYHIGCDQDALAKALGLIRPGGRVLIQLMSPDRQLYWALDRVRGLISSRDLRDWALARGYEFDYFEHSHWTPVAKLLVAGRPTEGFKRFVAFAVGEPWDAMGEAQRREAIAVAEGLQVDGKLETRHGYLVFG